MTSSTDTEENKQRDDNPIPLVNKAQEVRTYDHE